MVAVGEVHVEVPGGPEHRGVARGHAAEPVTRGIAGLVGLGLNDAPGEPSAVGQPPDQGAAEQVGGDLDRRPLVERSGQPGAAQEPPFRRNRSSFVIGQALITSSFVSQPR